MTTKLLVPLAALLMLTLAACSEAPTDDSAEPAVDAPAEETEVPAEEAEPSP